MKSEVARKKIIAPSKNLDRDLVKRLSLQTGLSEIISSILVLRGVDTPQKAHDFFNPSLEMLFDPFLLKGMNASVERIKKAIIDKEKIVVYGDYDVDGVTSTSLLLLALRKLGAEGSPYIPNRFIHGYGISIDCIKEIKTWNASLLITVDTGITAVEEIRFANSQNIDVIITDHHIAHAGVPPAFAIVNPKQEGCAYPDKNLCGVGVTLKLVQALYASMEMDISETYDFLDLVAIGITADIVPLIGENRVLVQLGFQRLSQTTNLGLIAILELNGLIGKDIKTNDVCYKIAPILNAVGRIGDPEKSFRLLTEYDSIKTRALANDLYNENQKRKNLDRDITEKCFKIIEAMDLSQTYFIVLDSPDWHEGVVGIVASRVAEKYNRPALIIASGDNGFCKGSARSIGDFHLVETIKKCEYLLERFGGHKYAAGLTIRQENIPLFRDKMNDIAKKLLSIEDFTPKVRPEIEINFSNINFELAETIKKLEPFGPENERPLFISYDVTLLGEPRILGGSHLKCRVSKNGFVFDAILWGQVEKLDYLISHNKNLSLVFYIEINEWNNKKNIQLNILEIE